MRYNKLNRFIGWAVFYAIALSLTGGNVAWWLGIHLAHNTSLAGAIALISGGIFVQAWIVILMLHIYDWANE